MTNRLTLVLLNLLAVPAANPVEATIPASFDSRGSDRRAIQALLGAYTKAVTTKNVALFDSLLLNRTIPFSSAGTAKDGSSSNYEDFHRQVFMGPPFTQTFRDIHISQDGMLADVSLVFVNKGPQGSSWGWKTMQLLKANGQWKIASEFYTGHPLK